MYFKGNLPFQGGFFISEMQWILCNFSSQMWQYWGFRLTSKREGLWECWGMAGAPGPCLTPRRSPGLLGVINAPQSGQETSELWVPLHWRSFSSAVGNAARQKTGTSSRNRGPQFLGNKSLFYPLPKVHNLPENVLPNEFPRKQKITSKPLIFKTQPEATTEKFWLRRNAVRNKWSKVPAVL